MKLNRLNSSLPSKEQFSKLESTDIIFIHAHPLVL